MNSLTYERSQRTLQQAMLHELEDCRDAFDDALRKVVAQGPEGADLAKKALSWLAFTTRRLTMSELREALATKADHSEIDPGSRPRTADIISACCGLAVLQHDSGSVDLVHHTLREYLSSAREHLFAENEIGMACVRYLSMAEFESGACSSEEALEKRLRSRPLYEYAAQNWGRHLCDTVSPTKEIFHFLASRPKLEAAFQASMKAYLVDQGSDYIGAFARKMSRLHVAAYAGAANVVKSLLDMSILLDVESSLNERDSHGQTPLCWAAQMERGTTVKLLLEDSRVHVDLRNYAGRTPLSLAAEAGNGYIVEQLLARGANPNSRDIKQTTPLWYASKAGHGATVKLLLLTRRVTLKTLNSKQPYHQSGDLGQGDTPLAIAARKGHTQVVRLLLEEPGIDPYIGDYQEYWEYTPLRAAVAARDEDVAELFLEMSDLDPDPQNLDKAGRELLACAAGEGSTRIVERLLTKHNVNPNPWEDEWSALVRAAGSGHEEVVQLLLATEGVQPDAKDIWGRTALYVAVERRRETIVKMLLAEKLVDRNSKAFDGKTPLSLAAASGDKAIVELLLEDGSADLQCKDDKGFTPLSRAAYGREYSLGDKDNHEVVALLLATGGIEINFRDNEGRTALSHAAYRGRAATVRLLLSYPGIDTEPKDKNGWTPMLLAVSERHQAVAELLLDLGVADLNCATFRILSPYNDGLRTALSLAAAWGPLAVVKLLTSRTGIDLNAEDEAGRTPLAWAARFGKAEIVQHLLTIQDVNPHSRDQTGLTPLAQAAKEGKGGIVRIFLGCKGVDPDPRDMHGRTPLSFAAEGALIEVVELLLAIEGVDPDSKDNSGRTPLSWAVGDELNHSRKKVIRRLLQISSVNPNAEDNEGQTPMDWAIGVSRGDEIVDILLTRKETKSVLDIRKGQRPDWIPENSGSRSQSRSQDAADISANTPFKNDIKQLSSVETTDDPKAEEVIRVAQTQQLMPTNSKSEPRAWFSVGTEMEMDLSDHFKKKVRIGLRVQQNDDALPAVEEELCRQCEQIDWNDAFSRVPPPTGRCLIPNLGTVDETWEKRPCALCRLLASIRPRSHSTAVENNAVEEQNHQLQAFSSTDVWLCQGDLPWHYMLQTQWIDTVFLAVVPDDSRSPVSPGGFEYAEPNITLSSWLRESLLSSGFVARVGSNCPYETRSLDIRKIISNVIDFTMVRSWIDFCAVNHSRRCKPRTTRPAPHLRLIECATRRIIEPSSTVPFVALSYVWGSPPAGSESEDYKMLSDDAVEQVVDDAILVAVGLGYGYLWVDRYCITKKHKAIREEQLRNMDVIYGSAELTVVAAAGSDSSFGLPGIRPRQPRKLRSCERVAGHVLVSIPPDPASVLESSTWATRGWTYQEGLLSQRSLIFTEHEISYECRRSLFREAIRLPLRIHNMSLSWANRLQWASWSFQRNAGSHDIFRIISRYTLRRLTYESDILNAMLGIFHGYMNKEIYHLCGVPVQGTAVEGLANGLWWDLLSPGHRRPGFPSWSWTGWSGVVAPDSDMDAYISFSGGLAMDVSVLFGERQPSIPFGEYETMDSVEKSTRFRQHHILEISVLTIPVELREEPDGSWRATTCIGDDFLVGTFSPTRDPLSGQDHAHFARKLRDESWLCMIIGRTSDCATCIMIVVEYVPSSRCWERVGLVTVRNVEVQEEMFARRNIRLG